MGPARAGSVPSGTHWMLFQESFDLRTKHSSSLRDMVPHLRVLFVALQEGAPSCPQGDIL